MLWQRVFPISVWLHPHRQCYIFHDTPLKNMLSVLSNPPLASNVCKNIMTWVVQLPSPSQPMQLSYSAFSRVTWFSGLWYLKRKQSQIISSINVPLFTKMNKIIWTIDPLLVLASSFRPYYRTEIWLEMNFQGLDVLSQQTSIVVNKNWVLIPTLKQFWIIWKQRHF